MKTDEQMTNDIRSRVAAAKTKKAAARRRAGGALFALILAAAATLGGMHITQHTRKTTADPQTSAEITQQAPHGLSLLIANAENVPEGALPVAHGTDVSLPVHGFLTVDPITGLGLSRIEEIKKQKMSLARELGIDYGYFAAQTQDRLFCFTMGEQFAVQVEDPEALESVTVSCGETGAVGPHATLFVDKDFREGYTQENEHVFCITGDRYREFFTGGTQIAGGLRFRWFLSASAMAAFDADPAMTAAQVSDEVTVTARYTDGACESFTVSVGFAADGTLIAGYSG